jgi:DNA mismatch repair ATPase MutS
MAHVEEEGGEEEARLARDGQRQEPAAAAHGRQGQEGAEEEGEEAGEGSALQQQRVQAALGRVVFLFRLVEGVAPASFGINVARMAQLPPPVLARAAAVAERVQRESEARRRRQQLVALAQRCQRYAARCEEAGQVDVEGGRELQERARQLLAA